MLLYYKKDSEQTFQNMRDERQVKLFLDIKKKVMSFYNN